MNNLFRATLNDKSKRVIKSEVKKNKIINPYMAQIETIRREKSKIVQLYNSNNNISNNISIEYTIEPKAKPDDDAELFDINSIIINTDFFVNNVIGAIQENNDIVENKNNVNFNLDAEIKKDILDSIFKANNDKNNHKLPDDFDINEFNSKLNINFNTDTEIKKDILDVIFKASSEINNNDSQVDVFDINDVHKRNIKNIYNVYQEKYNYNTKATGFGDFIRGCYYLLDFCEKYGFNFNVLINHPMTKFFKKQFNYSSLEKYMFSNITFFTKNNWDGYNIDTEDYIHSIPGKLINGHFVSYLRDDIDVYSNSVFIYSIAYPSHIISEKHKTYIRNLLEPNDEIQQYINSTLNQFEFTKHNYSVIHIRTGDTYLNQDKSEIYNNYISKLVYEISKTILKNEAFCRNYILISDNLNVKYLITKKYPFLKSVFKEITHLGEGVVQEDEKIKNTLLDFYLLSLSNSIFSFSCYEHGSGFSQWCAETYNIPYYCKSTF